MKYITIPVGILAMSVLALLNSPVLAQIGPGIEFCKQDPKKCELLSQAQCNTQISAATQDKITINQCDVKISDATQGKITEVQCDVKHESKITQADCNTQISAATQGKITEDQCDTKHEGKITQADCNTQIDNAKQGLINEAQCNLNHADKITINQCDVKISDATQGKITEVQCDVKHESKITQADCNTQIDNAKQKEREETDNEYTQFIKETANKCQATIDKTKSIPYDKQQSYFSTETGGLRIPSVQVIDIDNTLYEANLCQILNDSVKMKFVFVADLESFTPVGTSVPEFKNETPKVSDITETNFTLEVELDKTSRVYYVVLPDNGQTDQPNAPQVKEGKDSKGQPVDEDSQLSGSFNVVSSNSQDTFKTTKVITGLKSNTNYVLYVTAENASSKSQLTSVTKLSVPAEIDDQK